MRRFDDFAADMIPTRLIVSIAIIAAITLLVAFGYRVLSINSAENKVEQDCRALESELFSMIASGVPRDVDDMNADDGTMRSFSFNLPDSLVYLSFGVDPDPDNNGELTTGLTVNGSIIFYMVDGGSKKVVWLNQNFRFREGILDSNIWVINGDGQGYIIQGGGESTLIFELVKQKNESFILIHGTDNF